MRIDAGLNNSYFHSKGSSLNYLLFWVFQIDIYIIKVQTKTSLNESGVPVKSGILRAISLTRENREKECPGL